MLSSSNRWTADADGDDADRDVYILALLKGAERYVFFYDAASREECLQRLGRFASNPELSFTWYDCAVLAQRVRSGKLS